jgi:hypothetical protein
MSEHLRHWKESIMKKTAALLLTALCFVSIAIAATPQVPANPKVDRNIIFGLTKRLDEYPIMIQNASTDASKHFEESREIFQQLETKLETRAKGAITPLEHMRVLVQARFDMIECYQMANRFIEGLEFAETTLSLTKGTRYEVDAHRHYMNFIGEFRGHLFHWWGKRTLEVAGFTKENTLQLYIDAFHQLVNHPLHGTHPDPLKVEEDIYDYAYFAEWIQRDDPQLAVAMFEKFFIETHATGKVEGFLAIGDFWEPYQKLLKETKSRPHRDIKTWSKSVDRAKARTGSYSFPRVDYDAVRDFYTSYLDVWQENLRKHQEELKGHP